MRMNNRYQNKEYSDFKYQPSSYDRIESNNFDKIPLSGRYEGNMIFPNIGVYGLELRIDIDQIYDHSPVMNCISGDFFRKEKLNSQIGLTDSDIFIESWIIDNSRIKNSISKVEIYGEVSFWKRDHPKTTIHIDIPKLSSQTLGPIEVNFTDSTGNMTKYNCIRKSDSFRSFSLKIDVAKSVNIEPILPIYDTHWQNIRPASIKRRLLSIEECYRDAGINVSISSQNQIIDDALPQFQTWSDDELHDVMETHFLSSLNKWPQWQLWCLICGGYDQETVAGVMFDGGPLDKKPQRQGFAIFRNHHAFNNLVQNPTTQNHFYALREYLYTFIHEAGHAFNLSHSFDKGRRYALSWMNYPNEFLPNEQEFWKNFMFRYDDKELLHIRHGNRLDVIMGGSPRKYGSYLEDSLYNSFESPKVLDIEFLLRSQGYFQFMEHIIIEVRLKNKTEFPIEVDTLVNPEFHKVVVFIQGPDGKTKQFIPIMYKEGIPAIQILSPSNEKNEGTDRYSENIVLTYGKDGFYFNQPGEYLIRALYFGNKNFVISSNVHRINVGYPKSDEEDKLMHIYTSHDVGMHLYLRGSNSPYLEKGKNILEKLKSLQEKSSRGASLSDILASLESRHFFKVQENGKLKEIHKPDYNKVLEISEPAKEFYIGTKDKHYNLKLRNIINTRKKALKGLKRSKEAQKELRDLANNIVEPKESVLKEIEKQEKQLAKD